jgi:hypothetical protein
MKNFSILFIAFASLLFSTVSCVAQSSNMKVIQFHSDHRCITCLKIEKLTKATLANNYPNIPFVLVNADDKKNTKIAEQFEATGTALYLHDTKTGKKKDLTDFAFMNASDEKKFESELKKHIDKFAKK